MPQLVQFADLTPAHFAEHPVWASCHSFDYEEPWYDDTDEETFRPYTGAVPVDPSDGMYLVRASFELNDGASFEGFITPAHAEEEGEAVLGVIQPQLYLPSGARVSFWLGMFGEPDAEAEALYRALGRERSAVFPIAFSAQPAHASGIISGQIAGFYIIPDGTTVRVVA